MAWEFAEPGYLRRWILGDGPDLNTVEQQDTPWIIAEHFRADELIEAFETPGGIPERRDELLFCLGLQLDCYLEPDHPDSAAMSIDEHAAEFERLSNFVLAHSHDYLERHQELGFGGDYDTIVIPFIESRIESPSEDT